MRTWASYVFSSKDNRTVILTRQDLLPDRTANRVLLFIFSSIKYFRRSRSKKSFVLYKYLAHGSKTHRDFIASWAASRPENLVSLASKTYFQIWNSCQRSIVPSPVISAWFARVLASNVERQKNAISTLWIITKVSKNYIMISGH